MKVELVTILRQIKLTGAELALENGQLKLKRASHAVSDTLLGEIRKYKSELIHHLKSHAHSESEFENLGSREYYEVSPFQREIWFNSKIFASTTYNQVRAFRIKGSFHFDHFKNALKDIINRYEILRTTFVEIDGQPFQKVHDTGILFSSILKETPEQYDSESAALEYINQEVTQIFDLENGPLVKVRLLELSNNCCLFSIMTHHIIMDGWSFNILLQQLMARYRDLANGDTGTMEPLKFQYKEFAAWLNTRVSGVQFEESRLYWNNYLEGNVRLDLSTDFPRQAARTFSGAVEHIQLDKKVINDINRYCNENVITAFIFFQGLIKALFYRYTGQTDILTGSPFAGRERNDLEDQLGNFINTLPVRTIISHEDSFNDLINNIKKNVLDIYSHQFYPFEQILKDLNLKFDRSRSNLFDVAIIVQNFFQRESRKSNPDNIEIEHLSLGSERTTHDICFIISDQPDQGIEISINYNNDLFEKGTIKRVGQNLVNLLKQVIVHDNAPLRSIEYLSPDETNELLNGLNPPRQEFPGPTIPVIFDEMVKSFPDHVALISGSGYVTYKVLDKRSTGLANYLRKKSGFQEKSFVGVLLSRESYLIEALLGILKAGAIYMPLEEDLPDERIREMCRQVNVKLLISSSKFEKRIAALGIENNFLIDKLKEGEMVFDKTPSAIIATDPACAIFTSGSTGVPKTIVTSHEGLLNSVLGFARYIDLKSGDNYLQFLSTGFDGSLMDFFATLLSGAKLVMIDKAIIRNADNFADFVARHQISTTIATPSYLGTLRSPELPSIEKLVFAGEVLDENMAIFYARNKKVFNAYGPAEGTIITSICAVESTHPSGAVSIGRPSANKNVYILDDALNLLPKGLPGELCISGSGVVAEYFQNPELSEGKFMPDPFKHGLTLYRTGDLAKWDVDGNLLFLGRKDDQVKIAGQRFELGEIESKLMSHERISKAVVLITGLRESQGLTAFFQGYGDQNSPLLEDNLSQIALRSFLRRLVPAYMIPSVFIEVDKWPLSPSGKIDKTELLNLAAKRSNSAGDEVPLTSEQRVLSEIWTSILGVKKVGIHDDFFELGGNSMKVIQLVTALNKTFECKVSFAEIFENPTIETLSQRISLTHGQAFHPLQKIQEAESYPLSYLQNRIWAAHQINPATSSAYNIAMTFKIEGQLNFKALEESLRSVYKRHESLRTVFPLIGDTPRQVVLPFEEKLFELKFSNISDSIDWEPEAKDLIQKNANQPFDINRGPLVRAMLTQVSADQCLFTIVIHHIVSDGWSLRVLMRELLMCYESNLKNNPAPLQPLLVQYKDFSQWYANLAESKIETNHKYWHDVLKQVPARTGIFPEAPHSNFTSFEGNRVLMEFDNETKNDIKNICLANKTTLFVAVLSIIKVLIFRYTERATSIVGTSIAERDHPELENQIGLYINFLPLATELNASDSLIQVLAKVKETVRQALTHKHYPYDRILSQMQDRFGGQTFAPFDVILEYQGYETEALDGYLVEGIRIGAHESLNSNYKYNLTFSIHELSDKILFSIAYDHGRLSSEQVSSLATGFSQLLATMISKPESLISTVSLLNKEDEIAARSGSDTFVGHPTEDAVTKFERIVELFPENLSMVGQGDFTYAALNRASNRIAHVLISKYNIRRGDIVMLLTENSAASAQAILGILKAGGVYVPVNPKYPVNRINSQIADANPSLIIHSGGDVSYLDALSVRVFDLNATLTTQYPETNPGLKIQPDDPAYVIYTSGSTGKPKGVMVTHRNLVRLFFHNNSAFDFGPSDVWVLFHSISFDFSVWEMFGALFYGGKLVIIDLECAADTVSFIKVLEENKVTVLNQTPGALKILSDVMESKMLVQLSVRYLILGGEKLYPVILRNWNQWFPGCRIVNMYGITETTVHVTYKVIGAKEIESNRSMIGWPIPTLYTYVLDAHRNLVPKGCPGELYVGGEGVAAGYLNSPELTRQRFVVDPFFPGRVIYRTGDIVCRTENNELEYFWRKDRQVKIRGFRIELGEIEEALLKHPQVQQAFVESDQEEQPNLMAFYSGPHEIRADEIRLFLGELLPSHSIPAFLHFVKKLPTNVNGKIDKEKLNQLRLEVQSKKENPAHPVAHENENEKLIIKVVEGTLRAAVSLSDNLYERGLDSIKAIQLSVRLESLGLKIAVKDILSNPTVAHMSINSKPVTVTLDQSAVSGTFPLTPIQRSFIESQPEEQNYFVQSVFLEIEDHISQNVLNKIYTAILNHHDALRIRFERLESVVTQINDPLVTDANVLYYDLRSDDNYHQAIPQHIEQLKQKIDIENGPLFRMAIFALPSKTVLYMLSHHLIVDGVSWRILIEDIQTLFEQHGNKQLFQLPSKTTSFKEWSESLASYANDSSFLEREKDYWKSVVTAGHSSSLSVVNKKQFCYQKDIGVYTEELTPEYTNYLLTAVNKAYNTETKEILLTALMQSLSTEFNYQDIVVFIEGHGRESILPGKNINRTVGWFTSEYPVLFKRSRSNSVSDEIILTKESIRQIPGNGIGYGILKYLSSCKSEFVLNPEIIFNYLGQFSEDMSKLKAASFERGASAGPKVRHYFKLNFNAIVVNDKLAITLAYDTFHFSSHAATSIVKSFINALTQITDHCLLQKEATPTPSDFTFNQFTVEELNDFLSD